MSIDKKFIKSMRYVFKKFHKRDVSEEQIEKISELAELMMQITTGEFECKTCKEKLRFYLLRGGN